MSYTDITREFTLAVEQKSAALPTAKRERVPRPKVVSEADAEAMKHGLPTTKLYMEEAYTIVRAFTARVCAYAEFTTGFPQLNNIDKTHSAPRQLKLGDNTSLESSWSHLKNLTNVERDQIDLQARGPY